MTQVTGLGGARLTVCDEEGEQMTHLSQSPAPATDRLEEA